MIYLKTLGTGFSVIDLTADNSLRPGLNQGLQIRCAQIINLHMEKEMVYTFRKTDDDNFEFMNFATEEQAQAYFRSCLPDYRSYSELTAGSKAQEAAVASSPDELFSALLYCSPSIGNLQDFCKKFESCGDDVRFIVDRITGFFHELTTPQVKECLSGGTDETIDFQNKKLLWHLDPIDLYAEPDKVSDEYVYDDLYSFLKTVSLKWA